MQKTASQAETLLVRMPYSTSPETVGAGMTSLPRASALTSLHTIDLQVHEFNTDV